MSRHEPIHQALLKSFWNLLEAAFSALGHATSKIQQAGTQGLTHGSLSCAPPGTMYSIHLDFTLTMFHNGCRNRVRPIKQSFIQSIFFFK